jgi:hypothetical protein
MIESFRFIAWTLAFDPGLLGKIPSAAVEELKEGGFEGRRKRHIESAYAAS